MSRRKKSSMANLADGAVIKTDMELQDREAEVLSQTSINWQELEPLITDKDYFNKLRNAVDESTQKNESIGQLKDRIKSLGKAGLAVAKKVVELTK